MSRANGVLFLKTVNCHWESLVVDHSGLRQRVALHTFGLPPDGMTKQGTTFHLHCVIDQIKDSYMAELLVATPKVVPERVGSWEIHELSS